MTMLCNSRCVHCDIWKNDDVGPELTPAQWRVFLDNLSAWVGKAHIVFTGGEALLAEGMPSILSHAVSLGLKVELLSNGLIINAELADQLMKMGLEQITVSFDGSTQATHDRFRGGEGFYSKTVAGLRLLIEAREQYGTETTILLKTVVSSNNLTELAELAEVAKQWGLSIRYQPIEQNYAEPVDPSWYRRSPLWITDIESLERMIGSLKALRSRGAPIENSDLELDTIVAYFRDPEKLMHAVQGHDTHTDTKFCSHAVTNFVVSSNGDVRMCFMMDPVGNVTREKPENIWKNRARCWIGPCGHR
jgi:MoaA/NifB/PqqE/SkfB family radical SAM enzyme